MYLAQKPPPGSLTSDDYYIDPQDPYYPSLQPVKSGNVMILLMSK